MACRELLRSATRSRWKLLSSFFFFQAEDGIRDSSVTGVQTCALPISRFTRTSGANLAEEIGDRGGAREARVDRDYFCVAGAFRLNGPLESAGMVLGRITAHDEHHVGILHVDPAIGHRAPSERWSQT